MLASSLDRKQGISCLEAAIESVKKAIKERGGEVNVKAAPRAVTEEDNRARAILMETFEKQNTEISGDDD
jgi:translation initiation factor 2 subunit 1